MEPIRRELANADDGNRQMVDRLPAVEAGGAETTARGVYFADVVLKFLARHRNPEPPATITLPATLSYAPLV